MVYIKVIKYYLVRLTTQVKVNSHGIQKKKERRIESVIELASNPTQQKGLFTVNSLAFVLEETNEHVQQELAYKPNKNPVPYVGL